MIKEEGDSSPDSQEFNRDGALTDAGVQRCRGAGQQAATHAKNTLSCTFLRRGSVSFMYVGVDVCHVYEATLVTVI